MSITAQQRTMILAAVAALGVGGVAIDAVLRSKDAPLASASPAPDVKESVNILPGAPPGDLAELRKRYRPIVLKGPFKTRDFKTRRARPRETPRENDPEPVRPRKPGDLLLRLTSFLGHGEARVGLFEDRSSGTALFAKPGETLAGVAVKKVESERVVVLVAGKERSYGIGETLTLPASARGVLKPLRPAGSVKTESKRYTGTTKLPELSEKKKMSILERLKARRRASKLRAEGKNPDEVKDAAQESKTEESKTEESKTEESKTEESKTEESKSSDPAKEPSAPEGTEGSDDPDGPEGSDPEEPEGSEDPDGPDDPDGGSPDEPSGDEPNPDPDDPADDAPEGGEPSEDDPNAEDAPKSEPSPEPQSEDNQ